jgi:hypothetical protein
VLVQNTRKGKTAVSLSEFQFCWPFKEKLAPFLYMLIYFRLIQQLKESPANCAAGQTRSNKITLAYDAIQVSHNLFSMVTKLRMHYLMMTIFFLFSKAIKLLRREVVDGMKTLMKLAKKKQSFGMLPVCEEMISKVSYFTLL